MLALAAGLGAWVWGLGTRDTGSIPVIAAMAGEARVSLADRPNPNEAPHQDALAYGGGEAVEATVLAPPPPRPTQEDASLEEIESLLGLAPGATGGAPAAEPAPEAGPAAEPETGPVTEAALAPEPSGTPSGTATGTATGTDGPDLAALDPDAGAADPEAPQTGATDGATDGATEETAATPPEPAGPIPPAGIGSPQAPALSPPVPVRPHNLSRRMARASEEAVAEKVALVERAAQSPWQIQLGAFRNEVLTREQWQLIYGTHTSLLHDRALAVQTTRSGGELFYRLRVGPFDSRAEAAALCKALEARGQTCIVARNG